MRAATSVVGAWLSIETTALKINSGEPRIRARQFPSHVLKVLRGLHRGGYRACVVGGGVRDLLLDLQPKDFDIVTDARPEQVKKLFRRVLLIGRRFRLAHVMFGRDYIEVATFRGSGGEAAKSEGAVVLGASGRILRDNRFGSLEEDALRRDFTVNALYWDYASERIIDHAGGLGDIRGRRLRLIGEPRLRYEEDPVRMLRAARFAAKLGCRLDARCAKPIPRMARLLRAEPPARLLEEVRKLFLGGHALASFEQLRRFGLLYELFPLLRQWAESNPRAEAFLRGALQQTDQRLREGSHASLMFLLCVLFWGPVSVELGLGRDGGGGKGGVADVGEILRHSQIGGAFRRVAGKSSFGLRPPRKMMADIEEVLARQAMLQSASPRRVEHMVRHPLFRPAFRLLSLRRHLDEVEGKRVDFWRKQARLAPPRQWSRQRPSAGRRKRAAGRRAGGK